MCLVGCCWLVDNSVSFVLFTFTAKHFESTTPIILMGVLDVLLPSCAVFCALAGTIIGIFSVMIDGGNLTFKLVGATSKWDMPEKARATGLACFIYFIFSGILAAAFVLLKFWRARGKRLSRGMPSESSYGGHSINHAEVDSMRKLRQDQRRQGP